MSTLNEYKCPACGGSLEFNAGSQQLKCPFCDSEFDVEAVEAALQAEQNVKQDEIDIKAKTSKWDDDEKNNLDVYVCESCGGEIIVDNSTAATKCPYCDNAITVTKSLDNEFKPDIIIPFKIDKKSAKEIYNNFIKHKWLMPKFFKEQTYLEEIKGVYVPYWLLDCNASGEVLYKATKVRTWSTNSYNYTETSYYDVIREGNLNFLNIPTDASTKVVNDLTEAIEPFDLSEAVDFKTAYLAGYLADKYDVSTEEAIPRMIERVKESISDTFASTFSQEYTTVKADTVSVKTNENSFKYALYPVWLLNITYKGEKYTYAINGQTGKIVGNLPVDKTKYIGSIVGLTTVISILSFAPSLIFGIPSFFSAILLLIISFIVFSSKFKGGVQYAKETITRLNRNKFN